MPDCVAYGTSIDSYLFGDNANASWTYILAIVSNGNHGPGYSASVSPVPLYSFQPSIWIKHLALP